VHSLLDFYYSAQLAKYYPLSSLVYFWELQKYGGNICKQSLQENVETKASCYPTNKKNDFTIDIEWLEAK
jgi:hypothetical protein